MDSSFGPLPGVFDGLWVLAVAVIVLGAPVVVAGAVVVGVLVVRNFERAKARGHDPLTMQTDLTSRLLEADVLAPRRSKAERLAELDQLLAAGVIRPDEHAAGRAGVLVD